MVSWSLVLEQLIKVCPEEAYAFENKWTLEDVLNFLYSAKKMSTRQIANLTNYECSNITIRNKLRELGIKLRSKGGPNNTKVKIIPLEEYKSMSYNQLAAKYKVDRATVYKHVKQYIKKNGKRRGRPKLG